MSLIFNRFLTNIKNKYGCYSLIVSLCRMSKELSRLGQVLFFNKEVSLFYRFESELSSSSGLDIKLLKIICSFFLNKNVVRIEFRLVIRDLKN